jgi:hypothetical protein
MFAALTTLVTIRRSLVYQHPCMEPLFCFSSLHAFNTCRYNTLQKSHIYCILPAKCNHNLLFPANIVSHFTTSKKGCLLFLFTYMVICYSFSETPILEMSFLRIRWLSVCVSLANVWDTCIFLFPQTDRPEEANCSYNNDGEKSNVLSLDHLPPITTRIHFVSNAQNAQNDHSRPRFIPLEGCSASYAAQLHMERMFLSMNAYPYLHCNCYWNFCDT